MKPTPAPIINRSLADLFKGRPNPVELLAANQGAALMLYTEQTAHQLTSKGRPVVLECGHLTITKALKRASCARCGEMIRSGWDYDLFRNNGEADDFSWPDDPLRQAHERSRP